MYGGRARVARRMSHRRVLAALTVVACCLGAASLAGCGSGGAGGSGNGISTAGGGGRSEPTRGATSAAPTSPAAGPVPVEALQGPFEVVQVVDGDTVKIATGEGRLTLRLIGIDTPETVHPSKPVECFGPEASEEAARLLRGQRVWVELDPGQGTTDRYDRLLAYLWTSPTDMFNWHMIREGFATEYTYDTAYNHRTAFVAAERLAAGELRGLWRDCQTPSAG